MSVYLVTGVPGAGKSHETVRRFLVPAFENGRKVITNIGLNIEEIEKNYPKMKDLVEIKRGESETGDPMEIYASSFTSPNDYKDNWKNEKGQAALFVIDEAHFVFGSDNCTKDKVVNMTNFITTHRKLGIDIIIITQTSDMLERKILKLMESCYSCEKLDYLGASNSYRVNFLRKYNDRKAENVETHKYSSKIHSLYSSHEGNEVEETEMRKPTFYQLLKMYWFVGALVLLLGVMAFYFLGGEEKQPVVETPKIETTSINKTTQKNKIERKSKNSVKGKIPLWDKEIFIKSSYSENAHTEIFIFSVFENDTELFTIKSNELKKIGYNILTFEDNYCLVILKYKDYSKFSYCKKEEEEETTDNEILPV